MKDEKGSALLLAFVLSFLLMALGLGITMTSLTEFSMSNEFEGHEKAIFTADSGLAASEIKLRRRNLDEVLKEVTLIPTFFSSGPESERNPINTVEARNLDFSRLPASTGTYQASGLVTPPEGVPFGRGRYFARITDNDDGDGDKKSDFDGKVFIRVVGTYPTPPQELVLYNSNMKNSVSVVEAILERDMSLDVASPFSVYGPHAVPAQNDLFNGSSFYLDGYDHSAMSLAEIESGHSHGGDGNDFSAISVLNDDGEPDVDADTVAEIFESLSKNQQNKLVGAEGPYGESPSIRDDTNTVHASANEDATNIFSAAYLAFFINRIAAAADNLYDSDTKLAGSNIQLGTEDLPEITVATGDLDISGSGSGSGIMIVKGSLTYSGAFDYNGLILVMGEGVADFSGANKSIIGGVYLTRIIEDGDGNAFFGTPQFTISGQSNFYFRSDSVKMAINLLPFKTLGWREITREMMPPADEVMHVAHPSY